MDTSVSPTVFPLMEFYFLWQPQYYRAPNPLEKYTVLQGYTLACKCFSIFFWKNVFLSIQYAKIAHLQVQLPMSLKRIFASEPQGSNQASSLCSA